MNPVGMLAVQSRMAEIQSRFAPASDFAADLARAQAPAAPVPPAAVAPAAPLPPAAPPATMTPAPVGAVGAALPDAPAAMSFASAAAPAAPAAAALPGSWASRLPERGQQWVPAIESAAAAAGIDSRLLASVVQQESGFRADARSSAGAMGLGQLMPGTARELGVDPHDPVQNLAGAARYLRTQLDRFGSVELALAAYNAGPGRVAQAGGIPRITETQNYVATVTRTYDTLRST